MVAIEYISQAPTIQWGCCPVCIDAGGTGVSVALGCGGTARRRALPDDMTGGRARAAPGSHAATQREHFIGRAKGLHRSTCRECSKWREHGSSFSNRPNLPNLYRE